MNISIYICMYININEVNKIESSYTGRVREKKISSMVFQKYL